MKINSLKLFACTACLLLSVNPALADDKKDNDGQDPTRPLIRFDIRTLYTDGVKLPGDQPDANQTVVLGRIDAPIPLENKWIFYWRTDVPVVSNDVPSRDNPDRDREWGMGNWFNQLIWISPPGDYPLGMQVVAPGFQVKLDTASQDQFGNGRHTFVPLFAWRWQFGEKLTVIPVFKYEKDFGDQSDEQDNDVEQFQFKPITNIKLPDKWFLSFWDSTDWVLQRNDGPDDGDWNIPLDVMIGKRTNACMGFSEQCVYSFQWIEPVVEEGDFELYDRAFQLRLGYFF